MIDKPTHYIDESSSCIDLIFSSNVNLTKSGVEQSLYETCHHNIYRALNFIIPLPLLILEKHGIIKMQILNVSKQLLHNFDWTSAIQSRNYNKTCKLLSEALLNIFHNFIHHKMKKLIINLLNRLIKLLNYF